MKSLILFLFICVSNISIAQVQNDKLFPDSYLGRYKGDLIIGSGKGQQQVPMEFHLLETDSIGKYDYTIIYGAGESQQTRSYTLKEKDRSTGSYVLDENNGILLDARVLFNKMFIIYEVGGNLITTYLTFGVDEMIFEVVAAQVENKTVSGGQSDDIPEVLSYPVAVVQRAELQKVR